MANINLLTTKVAPKSSVVKASGTLKIIGLIWTIVLFIGILVMVSISLISSQQIKSSLRTQEALKTSVKSLQATEQQYVLLKDRASKISDIYEDGNATDEIIDFNEIIEGLPDGASVNDMEIVYGRVESAFIFDSTQTLTKSLAAMLTGEKYDRVVMDSFSFSPGSGYKLSLTFFKPS